MLKAGWKITIRFQVCVEAHSLQLITDSDGKEGLKDGRQVGGEGGRTLWSSLMRRPSQ